ncbi:type II secretion system protein [Geomonas azotofigens]|uniref:type II secretion system protein n=1 Tax=Geomonas azotofigens TaxID=2843196 RepID=UPI001F2FF366|nr:type II secretion system protein [Geomonas azotofigens]
MSRVLRSNGGFTYIGALVMAVIVGIMASRAAVVWSTAMKREREEELISRGTQIRNALRKWYKVKVVDGKLVSSQSPSNGPAVAPTAVAGPPEIKSLLQDPNTPAKLRYLRPYCLVDPITGKEWDEIRKDGKLIGVKSKSEQVPVKQGNFPFDLPPADFEKKKKYSEWEFVYDRIPPVTATGGAIQGLKTSGSPTPTSPQDTSGSDEGTSTRRSRFNRGNSTTP